MKLKFLIKASPFFSTLLLIFFLSISNQKEYTRLRLLIWNTPTLTLGSYLAISSGTGFLLSYLITTNIAQISGMSQKKRIRFREEVEYDDRNEINEDINNLSYDNTLIERDIRDPSPTIDASFRIISRNDKNDLNFIDNNNVQYDDSFEFEEECFERPIKKENINQANSFSSDWNDQSYLSW